jgi:hypothetical protein
MGWRINPVATGDDIDKPLAAERTNCVPIQGRELATRINQALAPKRKRVILEDGRSKYVLADFSSLKEVDLAKLATELECWDPSFETLAGTIS